MLANSTHHHPVVLLPPGAPVLDLTRPQSSPAETPWDAGWSIGRYDEDRAIYDQPLFGGVRTVHLGIDLGGPAGTAVHAPTAGVVEHAGYNPADGDYGHVIVTRHQLDERPVWVLFGHLSAQSITHSPVGRVLVPGDVIGWLGEHHENGGWFPHVHVQLCWERPETHDMPGAVARSDRAAGLALYPDPRRLIGPVY